MQEHLSVLAFGVAPLCAAHRSGGHWLCAISSRCGVVWMYISHRESCGTCSNLLLGPFFLGVLFALVAVALYAQGVRGCTL